jgi:Protein kinase domain
VLTVGEVVAGYRIERVLGSGGMGSVYLAANPTLPRLDAVKVLSAELSRDPDFRARFVREADVAAALDHPQIVSVYNRGETDDGQLWIAMQFVDGTDADAALRAGTMTAPRAVHIISEVAKALDFAHAHNVVHRDSNRPTSSCSHRSALARAKRSSRLMTTAPLASTFSPTPKAPVAGPGIGREITRMPRRQWPPPTPPALVPERPSTRRTTSARWVFTYCAESLCASAQPGSSGCAEARSGSQQLFVVGKRISYVGDSSAQHAHWEWHGVTRRRRRAAALRRIANHSATSEIPRAW